jgi:hypothetical protein
MQIETIGKYQVHSTAHELSDGAWDPFVSVLRFDDEKQDFVCELEKRRAADRTFASYNEAVQAALRTGTEFIESIKPH